MKAFRVSRLKKKKNILQMNSCWFFFFCLYFKKHIFKNNRKTKVSRTDGELISI